MTPRQRFHAIMAGKPFDRLPVLEWAAWWDKTIDRWHQEGLPTRVTDRYAIGDYLGLDAYRQWWLPVLRLTCPRPPGHGQPILRSFEEYRSLRAHLYPDPAQYTEQLHQWKQWTQDQQRNQAVLWITLPGFFWFPRILLGIEGHMYAFYDQPELLHQINCDLAHWHRQAIDRVCEISPPDFMTFAEDMSYNLGPMLSQQQFEQFMAPYYQQIVPLLAGHGVIPLVDSDGDIALAAPWFERAGIAGILPLERKAGVDLAVLRRNHPKMCFVGHFDKLTMSRGEAAMRAEFERLLPIATHGRFLISCDHQTPPEVSWKDYQTYLRLFFEYADFAGQQSQKVAWTDVSSTM